MSFLLPALVAVAAFILTRHYLFTPRFRIINTLLGALIGVLVWTTQDGVWLALLLVQYSIVSDLYVANYEC